MTESFEVFKNAPLVEVAYELRFPSLFYIPQAIGEFQIKIMDDFPKASQLLTTQFAIEDGIPKFPGGLEKRPQVGNLKMRMGKPKLW
jgi:uncharacterized protein (TIGR04255 family)